MLWSSLTVETFKIQKKAHTVVGSGHFFFLVFCISTQSLRYCTAYILYVVMQHFLPWVLYLLPCNETSCSCCCVLRFLLLLFSVIAFYYMVYAYVVWCVLYCTCDFIYLLLALFFLFLWHFHSYCTPLCTWCTYVFSTFCSKISVVFWKL